MAETSSNKLPSKEELLKRLNDAAESGKALAGKPGINPFVWINTVIKPLEIEIKSAAAITSELVEKVAKVKTPDPVVNEVKEVNPTVPKAKS